MRTKEITVKNMDTMVEDLTTLMAIKVAFEQAGFQVEMREAYGKYSGRWVIFKGNPLNYVDLHWDFPLTGFYSSQIDGAMKVALDANYKADMRARLFKRTKKGWKIADMLAYVQESIEATDRKLALEKRRDDTYRAASAALEGYYRYGCCEVTGQGIKLNKTLTVEEFEKLAPKLVELGLLQVKPEK